MDYPVEIEGLTKRFTAKRTLNEDDLGFAKPIKRLFRKIKGKETILAVNDVSFKIKDGELFGLLGPNGAGKTTLTKMLCTLLWPNDGTAQVNGHDIRGEPGQVRASIGTVLDVYMGWYGRLSCRQNLLFYAQLFGIRPPCVRRRISEVLELVGLTEKADDWQQKLSSGMKRKLDVARALLPDPPILLLDEPTIQLDPKSARELRRTMKDELCRNRGKTILWTTHNMHEAEEICDRVAIMHRGGIVALGGPEEVKRFVSPNESIVLEVGRAPQAMLDELEGLEGAISISLNNMPSGQSELKVQVRDEGLAPRIAQTAICHGAEVHSMRVERPTLEEALIKLTEG